MNSEIKKNTAQTQNPLDDAQEKVMEAKEMMSLIEEVHLQICAMPMSNNSFYGAYHVLAEIRNRLEQTEELLWKVRREHCPESNPE